MTMTSEAKRALSTTIRSLRARLLDDLHAATETVYRLSVRAQDAGLSEAARIKRGRLDAWVNEQLRAQKNAGNVRRTEEDFRREVEKQAAYTLLNRIVLLRLMENAPGPSGKPLRSPAVVTGGWQSRAYLDFRQVAPALVQGDETEGYAFLLELVFEDLATELPGLYGSVGLADLVPIPLATLRHVVDELDKPELESCWTDDMTLGWVYQYWNDSEREVLDAKVNAGGKVESHEIASKTQLFTERYIVDWLVQNSLNPMWLAMCKKNGWIPEVEADGTLARLEERRIEWRAKRKRGEVSLTDLMPLYTDAERRWAYYVPQPIPEDAVKHAPKSVRDLKILDPAMGSGHFLIVLLWLLVALYREEARHRELEGHPDWTDKAIVERILAYNLHGIDLDPRAVQIAAAALWLKAKQIAPDAQPERMNLVASNLRLASLPDDDPALVELRREVERETGIPAALTDSIIHALRGADHLGSLLKVSSAVEEAIQKYEGDLSKTTTRQGDLFEGKTRPGRASIRKEEAQATILGLLETFLARHTSGDDLGLRLRGEQLAAGVRFVRMVKEGSYHLAIGNPPYLAMTKMRSSDDYRNQYTDGAPDYFAGFLLRALELVRVGGASGFVTLSNWMFLRTFYSLRVFLLSYHIPVIADFGKAAFSTGGTLISTSASIFRRTDKKSRAVALRTHEDYEPKRDEHQPIRTEAALLSQVGRHEFDPTLLEIVPGWPIVYWWDSSVFSAYRNAPLLGDRSPATIGASTGNNARFVRMAHEIKLRMAQAENADQITKWAPFINGAKGRTWQEELRETIYWDNRGLGYRVFCEISIGANFRSPHLHFRRGIAFSMIGANFKARVHRFPSIFGGKGASIFPNDLADTVCAMNSTRSRTILQALNPGIGFEAGDVNRLPLFAIPGADTIFSNVDQAFTIHESHREPSVEFRSPGPSPWRHAQEWAQTAVDRPDGAPLPPYKTELDPEPPTDHLSYALGVALGRFGPNGEGILDPAKDDLSHALPAGILFLDTTLSEEDPRDSLGHPAAAMLHAAWSEYGPKIDTKRTGLRDWLALDFFKDVHKGMYENRPIHWPLSSSGKTFVAWVNIHRMNRQTLFILLADHLNPALARLEGDLQDLRATRSGSDKAAARAAERQYDRIIKARDELTEFIAAVEQCAGKGAPPTDAKCPPREQDARYAPDLDDGVMINSAGLWPLLEPQWKDPKKWWKELATAQGKKDYDWSHLAMRYWPTRVDGKCQEDPSLGVAHGCFWRYHPERAWAWELRLQDEIAPDFRIEEAPYRPGGRDLGDGGDEPHRDLWIADHAEEALAAVEREAIRRMGRGKQRNPVPSMTILERGLWSRWPFDVWAMELRLSGRQNVEFVLLAPDETPARADFEKENPELVETRREFMATLATLARSFDDLDEGTQFLGDDESDDILDDEDDGESDE